MPLTSLLLVRHGETEWNKRGIIQGQTDIPLSETGVEQARAVARYLSRYSFDTIISSDLCRAAHTASIINEYHNHPIKIDPLLREQHYGVAQGMARNELYTFPLTDKTMNQLEEEYKVPQAESYAQLVERVVSAVTSIIHAHAGQTLLIVTHAHVIRTLVRHALNDHRRPMIIDNCAIACFTHEDTLLFYRFEGENKLPYTATSSTSTP